MTVLIAELLEHPEANVSVVKKRNVQPAFDRSFVDRDLLQAIEKGFGKYVVEDVDFQIHQTVRLNMTLEERVNGLSRARPDARARCGMALPRQAT